MKNKSSSKKQPVKATVVLDISQQLKEMEAEFNNAFVLTDKGILVQRQPGPFEGTKPLVERKFKTSEEMQEVILNNSQILFGENALLISEKKEKNFALLGSFLFQAVLFDFRDVAKPKLHLIAVLHAKQKFSEFFFRMTDFFAFIRNNENRAKFHAVLCEMVNKDQALLKEMMEKIGDKLPSVFLSELLERRLNIVLVTDAVPQEFPAIMETYTETWGAMVKPIQVRKYERNGETLVTIKPDFASLQNGKKQKADIVPKTTEGAHLESVSASVKDVYEKIKAELLKQDKTLLFNVKQYYISMKKTRNLAFFHLRKKNLYLVVMCAEQEVRKMVKHHIIKTLPASVQKFWNGDSTGIVIEQPAHLDEIINLLKKMVGNGKINGNEPASQDKGGATKEAKVQPKPKAKAKQGKLDKKLQAKKK